MSEMTQNKLTENEGIYLASVDLLRRLLRDNRFDRKILERLNRLNAKSMNCKAIALN